MAPSADRHPLNTAGRFYVDLSCIDCDQCRAMAPDFFGRDEESGLSYVRRQPQTDDEFLLVEEVAATCATQSVGEAG